MTLLSTTKAKSRSTGWNGDSSSSLGGRNVLEDDLEADQRAVGLQRREKARVDFAEMADNVLRSDLDRAGAAGMKPGGTAGHDLQRLYRRAGGGQYGERIGLGIEHVDRRRLARPMPADTAGFSERAAHAAGGGELILCLVALEYLADLEQGDVGGATVGVALRRGNETGEQARPHVGQFRRDRIGQR